MKRNKTKLLMQNRSALQERKLYSNKDGTYTLRVEFFDYDLKCTHHIDINYGMFGEALTSFENWSAKRWDKVVNHA